MGHEVANDSDELLTYSELAKRTGVTRGTLARWRHEGMPCALPHDTPMRFSLAETRAWIDARQNDPNPLRRLKRCVFNRKSEVYFATDATGSIKIGWSSRVANRPREMRKLGFRDVRILATLPGDSRIEALLHQAFAADHIEGEWFRPSSRLCAFVDGLEEVTRSEAA